MKTPLRVAVTGAAGQIGYSLLFRIAAGEMFGPDQPVILQLIEVPVEKAMQALEGVAMELDDCAFPLLHGIEMTSDAKVGFKDANWCLLVGSKPRGPGMERADLLKDNGKIFIGQGDAIDAVAADDCRVAVVGNPCNTNVMIAASRAKRLPPERFTAMVRLDQNRAATQLAKKADAMVKDVENVYIFGNHSPTMFPAFHLATINGKPVPEIIGDHEWLRGEFLETVGKRGRGDHRRPRRELGRQRRQRADRPRPQPLHRRGDALGGRQIRRALRLRPRRVGGAAGEDHPPSGTYEVIGRARAR